jgi:anaphase-promoting complex subunit 3
MIDKHSETRRQHLPDAAAVYCLQGKLWQAHRDFSKAVECYVEALKLNPFMWDAFLGLSETGNIFPTMSAVIEVLTMSRGKNSCTKHLQIESGVDGNAFGSTAGRHNFSF